MLALKDDYLLEIVKTQEGRLPAVPGKMDGRTGKAFDVLDNIFFQHGVGHAKRLLLRIKESFSQVVTIMTTQVAEGTTGFGEDLEFAGSFSQGLTPDILGANQTNIEDSILRYSTH
jgi:hypothetical protein